MIWIALIAVILLSHITLTGRMPSVNYSKEFTFDADVPFPPKAMLMLGAAAAASILILIFSPVESRPRFMVVPILLIGGGVGFDVISSLKGGLTRYWLHYPLWDSYGREPFDGTLFNLKRVYKIQRRFDSGVFWLAIALKLAALSSILYLASLIK